MQISFKWPYFLCFVAGGVCLVLALAFIGGNHQRLLNEPRASQQQIVIPILRTKPLGLPFVEVLIEGEKVKLLLDTSSITTALSDSFRMKTDKEEPPAGFKFYPPLHQATIEAIDKTWSIRLPRIDMVNVSRIDRADLDGMLSPQSLGGTCTVIDFIHNTMTVNYGDTPKSCNPPGTQTVYSQQVTSKQGIDKPLLQIHNQSGSQSVLALMDTGATHSLFSSTLISPLSIIKGKYINNITAKNENIKMEINQHTTIRLGNKLITLPLSGVFYNKKGASLVGMDILKNAKIFIHKSGLIQLCFS